jgi:hypothetical protein
MLMCRRAAVKFNSRCNGSRGGGGRLVLFIHDTGLCHMLVKPLTSSVRSIWMNEAGVVFSWFTSQLSLSWHWSDQLKADGYRASITGSEGFRSQVYSNLGNHVIAHTVYRTTITLDKVGDPI